ncbi:hypothetical protein COHA_008945 [Chlorella ohadii]|uniref:Uncharacterized protein n=1 Tax=Chlorella ohadii TaxID=2649997 RepID=A0AAD5DJ22_9CHLO|nr:hypothetical protein COHA_008945 [Chlorella ohadii]
MQQQQKQQQQQTQQRSSRPRLCCSVAQMGAFQKLQRVPCPQLQAWLEAEQGLAAEQAAEVAWQLALAFQSEQAALAGLPATFDFCRSQQLSGPEAAAVLCRIAKIRRENVVEFATSVQPVWLQLDSYFAAYVKERRQVRKRLPEHLTLASMLCSNTNACQALVMPPGHVQRWLDTVGTRLSAADLGAVLAKEPEIVTAAPDTAVAALDWAAEVLGPPELVARLVRGAPQLLQADAATLQRKLRAIAAAAGVTDAQAKQLVLKMPLVLTTSSDGTMREAARWLRHYFPPDVLWPLLLRGPMLLTATTTKLQRNADYLQAPPFGWDDLRLAAYILRFPQGFSIGDFRSESYDAKLLFLSEVVGVSRADLIEFHSNYLKYGLPNMAASYVLLRERAPQRLGNQQTGIAINSSHGSADRLADWCGMTIQAVREHLREWPRCEPGLSLLAELSDQCSQTLLRNKDMARLATTLRACALLALLLAAGVASRRTLAVEEDTELDGDALVGAPAPAADVDADDLAGAPAPAPFGMLDVDDGGALLGTDDDPTGKACTSDVDCGDRCPYFCISGTCEFCGCGQGRLC